MRRRVRGCQGFALMELLIAAALLASAGALLAGGLLWANRTAETRAQRAVLTQLLACQLSDLDGTLTGQEPAAGAFDPPVDDASWTLDIQPPDNPDSPLRRVTLTVSYHGQSVQAVTYRRLAEPSP